MAKDWTGYKVNRLTFVKATDKKRGHAIVWEALCDCGNITYVAPCEANRKTEGKAIKSCGCLNKEKAAARAGKAGLASRRFSPKVSSARDVWRNTYSDSNFDTFLRLSQEPCHYCGALPTMKYNVGIAKKKHYNPSELQLRDGEFTYNGLDRMDSSLGHTDDNVVPCCWPCNRAKGRMSYIEFLLHIEKMYDVTKKIRDQLKIALPQSSPQSLFHEEVA